MSSSLAHSPAEIVRQLIIDAGLGSDIGSNLLPLGPWPVYDASEPNEPDNCITVYDTLGHDDARLLLGGELQQHYGLQIRIRALSHPVGWVKGTAIRTFFSEIVKTSNVTLESVSYLVWAITRIGQLSALGYDTSISKRRIFTLNCTTAIDQR